MITEDYVSFETAKLLKEKGFVEATNRYYNAQYDQIRTVSDTFMWHWNDEEFMKGVLMEGAIAIPTLQMAMKWLRKVHKLGVFPSTYTNMVGSNITHAYGTAIVNLNTHELMTSDSMERDTYEEACEAAIKYCLENLI